MKKPTGHGVIQGKVTRVEIKGENRVLVAFQRKNRLNRFYVKFSNLLRTFLFLIMCCHRYETIPIREMRPTLDV